MSKNEPLSLEVFDNPEFGQMRILREGDKYLFCANDAAVALGYSNPRAALQRHCKGVAKRDTITPGGVQSLSYIPEGDLYRLIIHSKLPSAEKFEHWVFEEVLPCIRKTGGYMTDNLLNELMNEPDIIYKVTSDMLKERGQWMRLEGEVKAAKPKVEYFDSFIAAEDCTNIRTTAKEIQVPEKQFIAWMLKNKYLYRTAKGYLMPYAKKSNEGLFIVKDFYYGYGQIAHHTLITSTLQENARSTRLSPTRFASHSNRVRLPPRRQIRWDINWPNALPKENTRLSLQPTPTAPIYTTYARIGQ